MSRTISKFGYVVGKCDIHLSPMMNFRKTAKKALTKQMFCDIVMSQRNETLACAAVSRKEEILMTFGNKLKQIRIGSHLTQEQMADIIGVERKTIARYENDESVPRSAKTYERLAEHFNSSIDFWKNDTPDDFQQTAAIAYGADGKMQAQKLLEDAAGLFAGGALSDEDKDAVFAALQKVYWEIKVEKSKKEEK